MNKQLFLSIRSKRQRLAKRYGNDQADVTIVAIMEKINVSPIGYLQFAINNKDLFYQSEESAKDNKVYQTIPPSVYYDCI